MESSALLEEIKKFLLYLNKSSLEDGSFAFEWYDTHQDAAQLSLNKDGSIIILSWKESCHNGSYNYEKKYIDILIAKENYDKIISKLHSWILIRVMEQAKVEISELKRKQQELELLSYIDKVILNKEY